MLLAAKFFFALMCSALVLACATPRTSRTAIVQDVNIAEGLSPATLRVHPGDEVRWVNLRKDEVQIDIPGLGDKDLACKRGFSTWLGGTRESIELDPNETASLCFEDPGVVNYIVRADTPVARGKQIMQGAISIADTR